MMDRKLLEDLKKAEEAVVETEKNLGPDHPELADKLQAYANLLKQGGKRLDSVNVEARARAIRAKMYAEEEKAHGTTTTMAAKKVGMSSGKPPWAAYFGIAGIVVAVASLVLPQTILLYMLIAAFVLGLVDVGVNRSGYWRIALIVVFSLAAFFANRSLPGTILTDETPLARYNYANQEPELVAHFGELGAPQPVLSYTISLPNGYSVLSDDMQDFGRLIEFASEDAQTQTATKFHLLMIRLPDQLKKSKSLSLLKTARDFALPQLSQTLSIADMHEEHPREVEINGIEFAKMTFTGTVNSALRNGFAFVAQRGNALLVLAADAPFAEAEQELPKLDAAVYTLRRVKDYDDWEAKLPVAPPEATPAPADAPAPAEVRPEQESVGNQSPTAPQSEDQGTAVTNTSPDPSLLTPPPKPEDTVSIPLAPPERAH